IVHLDGIVFVSVNRAPAYIYLEFPSHEIGHLRLYKVVLMTDIIGLLWKIIVDSLSLKNTYNEHNARIKNDKTNHAMCHVPFYRNDPIGMQYFYERRSGQSYGKRCDDLISESGFFR